MSAEARERLAQRMYAHWVTPSRPRGRPPERWVETTDRIRDFWRGFADVLLSEPDLLAEAMGFEYRTNAGGTHGRWAGPWEEQP